MNTDHLRRLAQAATPGPWQLTHYANNSQVQTDTVNVARCEAADNAAYIASASPTVLLALLDEVDTLRVALSEYGEHDKTDCILSRWEAGEPTPDGGYQMKYAGKWYPKEQLPKCQCGLDAALFGGA